MWFCSLCTIIAAASTFTAGVPLVARHSRHQDSSHGPDKLNQWTPSTYPNHLQKRMFSWKGSGSTSSQINSAITIEKASVSDLTKVKRTSPPENLAQFRQSSEPSQSTPTLSQSLANPSSSGSPNIPLTWRPGPDIVLHKFQSLPTDTTTGSKTNLLSSHDITNNQPSTPLSAHSLKEPQREAPIKNKSTGEERPISSARLGTEPPQKRAKWLNKIRESWDKLLQNVQKWFSSWFSSLSKKTQSDENAAKSLTTTGTPPGHAASRIQTASTTHQTSEYEHAKPQAQNSDVKMAETAQTVTTHESSSLPILRFDFTRLYADPWSRLIGWLMSILSLFRKENPSHKAPTILSDNHSSSGLPKSVSLPNLSRQNPDEINDAAWLQTVSQMQHATYSVAEQESLHGFAPSTHEGQLVQALLQQVDTLELAQCIHQVFRRSGIKLYMLSQLLSINTIRDILIAYGATVGQKMEGMLVKQQISSTILGYLTSFIRDWPPALEPEKEPGIKTLPPNE
ncbi:hypothetical protein PSTG_02250 [Puccinia striiformis f. sp. tritici PST-78]|uniref:Rho-GAP domain-containing protein n=1 Tax=Puccinia striiformis f. sp. tritici PST-78 TaxID=1165861 RepID=A0A0L0VZX6_9BASI|nr:hypothetical protein PSTG_02250 [Puccinia striiformis f. sp. tritici PST-78]